MPSPLRLAVALLACAALAASWELALVSNKNDDTFKYYSDVWTSGTPFNTDDTTDTKNALFPAFSAVYVDKIQIHMDGTKTGTCGSACTFTFALPEAYRGKYTLQQLVTMDGGLELIDETRGSWVTRRNNYFKFDETEVSDKYSYQYYCSAMALNYQAFPERVHRYPFGAFARIGVALSSATPCRYFHAAEGIGLTSIMQRRVYSDLGSGRVVYYNSNTFKKAKVWVLGSPTPLPLERNFTQLSYEGRNTFPALQYKYPESIEHGTPSYSYVMMVKLLRSESSYTNLFFRHGDVDAHRSPALYFYSDNPGRLDSVDQYHNGRSIYSCMNTRYSTCESFHAHGWLSYGKWHQLAIVGDDNHAAFYIDGEIVRVLPYYDFRTHFEDDQSAFIADNYHSAAELSEVRYFNERLTRPEIKAIYEDWLAVREVCGDGSRSRTEDCDDGNLDDGDGCSSACKVEESFVCFGSNSTSLQPDRCQPGEYVSVIDFEDPDVVQTNVTFSEAYDMETGFPDWTMVAGSKTYQMPGDMTAATFTCAGKSMLGGYGICGNSCELRKAFTGLPAHNFVHLEVEVYWLDSWDSEWLYIYADDIPVFAQKKNLHYPAASSSFATLSNVCGHSGWNDDHGVLDVSFYHNSTSLNLRFASNLNSAPSDESWGVRSVKVRVGQQEPFVLESGDTGTVTIGPEYGRGYNGTSNGISLLQSGYVIENAVFGSSYSSLVIEIPGILTHRTLIEFWMRIPQLPTAYRGVYLELIRADTDAAKADFSAIRPDTCTTDNECASKKYYRICYQSVHEPPSHAARPQGYCDERQELNWNTWVHESVDLFDKMRFKYGIDEGSKEGHFALKFTARADYYGNDRAAELLLDDIKVMKMDSGANRCAEIRVHATQAESWTKVGDATYPAVENGWNVLQLDPATHAVLSPVELMTPAELVEFIEGLTYGQLFAVFTKGGSLLCDDDCHAALARAGISYPFSPTAAVDASFVGIGMMGARVRSMPSRGELWAPGPEYPAVVRSMVGCHGYDVSLPENSLFLAPLSQTEASTERVKHELEPTTSGYTGCYRWRGTGRVNCYPSSSYYTSYGTCAQCCRGMGYAYAHNYYYHYCYCADWVQEQPQETEQFDQRSCSYVCYQERRGTCGGWDVYYNSHLYSVFATSGATKYPLNQGHVTCSSEHASYPCKNLADHNEGTYYFSQANPDPKTVTINIDLPEPVLLESVRIYWYLYKDGMAETWKIDYQGPGDTDWQLLDEENNVWGRERISNYRDVIPVRPVGTRVSKLRFYFTMEQKTAQLKFREIFLNVYKHREDIEMHAALLEPTHSWSTLISPTYYYDQVIRAPLPHMKPWERFNVDNTTGILRLTYALLDYEAQPYYLLRATAIDDWLDTVVTMSVTGNNFVEIEHGLGYLPFNVIVRVNATDGPNQYFNFPGMGSVAVDGAEVGEKYGGVLFAYNENKIRLWAPSDPTYGFVVNVNDGWAASSLQSSQSANVRVQVRSGASPDYDSGWVDMQSQSGGAQMAQRDFEHGLGDLTYDVVKVLYRAVDGANAGYVFEGQGAALADDDGGSYGGVLFTYNDAVVRVMLPNGLDTAGDNCGVGKQRVPNGICRECSTYSCTHKDGRVIFVPAGYGGGQYQQKADATQVRVMVWKTGNIAPLSWSAGWKTMTANGVSYFSMSFNMYETPSRIKAVVRPQSAPQWLFEGVGAAQGSDARERQYAGAIFCYSINTIRIWAPAKSKDEYTHAFQKLAATTDGWGDGSFEVADSQGDLMVLIWRRDPVDMRDTRTIRVNVLDIDEPPIITGASVMVSELAPIGTHVATIKAVDPEGKPVTEFRLVDGNVDDTFDVTTSGIVTLAKLLDYNIREVYTMTLEASDGLRRERAIVRVQVLDGNRPPVVHPPFTREVYENVPAETLVGEPLNATDPDPAQSVLFYMLPEGNWDDAFMISACGGQIRVNNPQALDYEEIHGYNFFMLNIMVTDDGENAQNITVNINVTVLNANDRPEWVEAPVLEVEENSPIDLAIEPPLTDFCTDVDVYDELSFTVLSITSTEMSEAESEESPAPVVYTEPNGTSPYLFVGAEIDFESVSTYSLRIRCTDSNPVLELLPKHLSADTTMTLNVIDMNDPPECAGAATQYIAEHTPPGTTLTGEVLQVTDQDIYDSWTMAMHTHTSLFESAMSGYLVSKQEFDFETRQSYTVTMAVTDEGILTNGTAPPLTTYCNITVVVLDVNEAPTIANVSVSVAENVLDDPSPLAILVGSDPDIFANQELTFSIVGAEPESTRASVLVVNADGADTAEVLLIQALNYEEHDSFVLHTRVMDNGGDPSGSGSGLSSDGYLFVTVLDRNDPPTVDCDDPCVLYVDENSPAGTLVQQLVGEDEDGDEVHFRIVADECGAGFLDRFELSDDGNLTVRDPLGDVTLDFEDVSSFSCDIEVYDNNTSEPGPASTVVSVVVQLNDVNEAPVIDGIQVMYFAVGDNSPGGTTVGLPLAPYAFDEDGDVMTFSVATGATWVHQNGSSEPITNPFDIDPQTGQISVGAYGWPAGPTVEDHINITVTVHDGELDTSYEVQVRVTSSNTAPNLKPGQSCFIEENLVGPTAICKLVATDEEGDAIHFFLGSASEHFTVNKLTGELSLRVGQSLDYEAEPSYSIVIIVSDNRARDSLSSSGTVTIEVLDVNDPPEVLPSYTGSVAENEPMGTIVLFGSGGNEAELTFVDQDEDELSCTVVGTDSFEAVKAGTGKLQSCVIETRAVLDYESTQQHTFELQVTDGEATVTTVVVVNVLDVNEPPESGDVVLFIAENSLDGTFAALEGVAAVAVHDDDGDELEFVVVARDDAGIFALESFSDTSFGVYVAQDTVDGRYSLDFEDVVAYNLTIVAAEKETVERYNVTFVVTVYLTNVNDVTISQVVHLETGRRDTLSPAGGSTVQITGTDFGSMHRRTPVVVTYGPFGTEYEAQDCAVTGGGNTIITCEAVAGVGLEHAWTVKIDSALYSFDTAVTTDSQLFTSYLRPTISELSTNAAVIRTSGGDLFTVTGDGFGPAHSAGSNALYQFHGYVQAQKLGGGLWVLADPVAPGLHPCRAALSAYMASVGETVRLQPVECPAAASTVTVTVQGSQTMSGGAATVQAFAEELCEFDKLDESWTTADEGGESVDWQVSGSSVQVPGAQAVVGASSTDSAVLSACGSSLWRLYMKAGVPRAYLSNFEFEAVNGTLEYWQGAALRGLECTHDAADEVTCAMPAGVGRGYAVRLMAAGSLSDLTIEPTLSYHEPVILQVNVTSGEPLDTRGYTASTTGSLVNVYGMFFGPDAAFQDYGKGVVQYGPGYSAVCSVVEEAVYEVDFKSVPCEVSLLYCEPSPGIGGNHHWNVSVGGQTSELSEDTTSYKRPVILDMPDYQWPFSSTAGGDKITIFGDQFGPMNVDSADIDAEYGSAEQWAQGLPWSVAAQSCEVAVAHTSVVCMVGEGTGLNHSWDLIVGEQRSDRFDAFSSYTAPLLTHFNVANVSAEEVEDIHSFSTRGGQYVELLGDNFGPKHRPGVYSPSIHATAVFMDADQDAFEWPHDDCTVAVAHSSIVCRTVAGVGAFLQWTLHVDSQVNKVPTTSYGEPKLTSVVKVGAPADSGFDTAGGELVEINGTNLGPSEEYVDRLTYGPSGTEYKLMDASAGVNRCWFVEAHVSLRCYTLPGAGRLHYFTVVVGGQTNKEAAAGLGPYLSYMAPHIESVSPAVGVTKGGYSLTVTGSNFGPVGQFSVYFWGRKMRSVAVLDDTTLSFTVPTGQGSGHEVNVRHESDSCKGECTQWSNSASFSYAAPVLDRLYVRTFNLTGYMNLTLLGQFNSNPAKDGGSYGSGQSFSWWSDDGAVTTFNNYVYVFDVVANESTSLDEGSRVACQVTPSFGGYWTHDTIVCIVPRTSGSVLVDVGGVRSNFITFKAQSPLVGELEVGTTAAGERPTTGGFKLTVTGKYFGDAPEILLYLRNTQNSDQPFMNMEPCQEVEQTSYDMETQVASYTCVAPAGQGRNVAVVVRVGGPGSPSISEYTQGADCTPCFSYDPPSFAGYALTGLFDESRRRRLLDVGDSATVLKFPAELPTTGAGGFTIFGKNFGLSVGFSLLLDGVALPWLSHNTTEATVRIPEGVGSNIRFQLQVANQEVTAPDFVVNFRPPAPTTIMVGTADGLLSTMGGDSITIVGADFGRGLVDPALLASTALRGVGAGPYVGEVTMSDTALPIVDWNHSVIVLDSVEGAGQHHLVTVAAAEQASSILGLSFAPPSIATISPTHARTSGLDADGEQVLVTLTGLNFGPTVATNRVVHVGSALVTSFVSWGHDEVVFSLPSGQGANVSVFVEVAEQASNVVHFTYDAPLLLAIDPTIGPTDACSSWESLQSFMNRVSANPAAKRQCLEKVYLTLTGESFGTSLMKVQVGDEICDRSSGETTPGNWDCFDCNPGDCYQDHKQIVVRGPTAFGVNNSVYVWVEGRRDPLSVVPVYDYEPPEISFSSPGSVSQGYGYYNAQGARLTISGKNFGGEASTVEIILDDKECKNAQWNPGSFSVGDGFPYLTCDTAVDGVGAKNGTLTVADQTIFTPARAVPDHSVFSSICFASYNARGEQTDYYGVAAYRDYCAECPEGSLCVSGTNDKDPIAASGYWRDYLSVNSGRAKERCDKLRFPPYTTRSECPDFLGCIPSEACLGNNECKKGYEYVLEFCEEKRGRPSYDNYCESDNDCTGGQDICDRRSPEKCSFCNKLPSEPSGNCTCTGAPRCSMCTVFEYYKINGECKPCPSNVWLLIALFVGGILAFIWIGYYLNKKKFNLAFMSIGFDYFQVLAIFANTNIAWPNIVVDFMKISLFFSFDINLTAPECVMPDISYEMKWYATMTLPIAAGAVLLLAFWYKVAYKSWVQGKRGWKKLSTHGNALVALYVLMLYYLYLPLIVKALDVMNCNPAIPDDGHQYTDWTSASCDGGMCVCWEPGSVQMELVPYALLALLLYGLGFPMVVTYIIMKHRIVIKEDQLLRAMGTGDTRATNPEGYEVRKRYHKLYYHFKPGKIYWLLLVLARKFWVALAALMFKDNPIFQLAFILLVLFVAYVLQVKHRPFMSSAEREAELEKLAAKYKETADQDLTSEDRRKYQRIHQTLEVIRRKEEVEGLRRKKVALSGEGFQSQLTGTASYFWDYNTVELYLLACSIFVCVAGIMFESDTYRSRANLGMHLFVLTFLVCIVVSTSLVYYAVVFYSEVAVGLGYDPMGWVGKYFMSKSKQQGGGDVQEDDFAMFSVAKGKDGVNPIHQRDEQAEFEKEKYVADLAEENQKLMDRINEMKKQQQLLALQNAKGGKGGGGRLKKKKTAIVESALEDEGSGIAMSSLGGGGGASGTGGAGTGSGMQDDGML